MNVIDAVSMARKHLCTESGILPDLGFETKNIHFVDGEYHVTGRVFSAACSRMIKYSVVVRSDAVPLSSMSVIR